MKKLEEVTTNILNSFAGIVLFVVSFAAFYLPYEIRIIPDVARALPVIRYVCAGILVIFFFLLYISTLTVFRENWALWAALGFVLVLIFSTMMQGGDLENALGTYGLAGFFLVMDIAVFFKTNPKKYLLIAFFLLLLINIANTYTVLEYCIRQGTGMWETYGEYRNSFYCLVGNYNGGIEYVMPMAICGSVYAMRYGKWLEILNYAAMLMSLYMAIRCESLTQIIAFAAIMGFMVLGDIAMLSDGFAKFLKIVFQPVIFVGIDLAVFISVIVLGRSNWVQSLGIDPDFHNRRHIWNMAMEWIKANPIWGNGQETVAAEAQKITGYAHSHCTYLEIAYKAGFVGTVFMILMLAAAVVAIYRNRHGRVSYILTIMLFLFGLAAVAETYPMVYVMLCLGLIYYAAKNTNETDKAKDRVKRVRDRSMDEPGYRDDRYMDEPEYRHSQYQEELPKYDEPGFKDDPRWIEPQKSYRKTKRTATGKKVTQTPPPSAYEIQEDLLEQVGQRVQEVQTADEEEIAENLDNTVHIEETIFQTRDSSDPGDL